MKNQNLTKTIFLTKITLLYISTYPLKFCFPILGTVSRNASQIREIKIQWRTRDQGLENQRPPHSLELEQFLDVSGLMVLSQSDSWLEDAEQITLLVWMPTPQLSEHYNSFWACNKKCR